MMAFLFVVVYYSPAKAGLLSSASVTLSNPTAGSGSEYQFAMTTATQAAIKGIKIAWRTTASSGSQQPTSGDWSAANLKAQSGISGFDEDKTNVADGVVYLVNAAGASVNASTPITFDVEGITNAPVAAPPTGCTPNPTNNSSGTCYLRIQTYNTETIATMQAETAANIIDNVTIAYTVNTGVSVTAKVDPSLTFTVAGVAQGQAANGQTTSAASDYNSLPFGYLAVGTPKYLAQDIYTKTNANNGYTVSAKMSAAMTSVYGNDIDPFYANKDSHITWATPAAWASPNGTVKNSDTGWLGMNTNNGSNIGGWGTPAGVWGPLQTSANNVRVSTTPDLGTAATRISFAIEINVYQPADSYSGTLLYSCVPQY